MRRHLENEHSIDIDKDKPALKQGTLGFGGAADALKGVSRDDILFKLTLWLANSFRPYTTVEDPDFRDLIHMLRPGFELPKRDKIRAIAKKISMLMKAQVCARFWAVFTLCRSKSFWLCTRVRFRLPRTDGRRGKGAAT